MDPLSKFVVVLVLSVLCLVNVSKSARWSHSAYLSPDYRLLWSLGPGQQDITFELQVRTLGYVGFGFSRDGRMAGSDMVIGWVDQGQVYFQDRHVKDSPGSAIDREPEVDPSQDYQLLLGYENSTHTVLRFRRRLDTCDHHDIPITINYNPETYTQSDNSDVEFESSSSYNSLNQSFGLSDSDSSSLDSPGKKVSQKHKRKNWSNNKHKNKSQLDLKFTKKRNLKIGYYSHPQESLEVSNERDTNMGYNMPQKILEDTKEETSIGYIINKTQEVLQVTDKIQDNCDGIPDFIRSDETATFYKNCGTSILKLLSENNDLKNFSNVNQSLDKNSESEGSICSDSEKSESIKSGEIPLAKKNDTMRIIWAFHKSEPVGGAVGPKSLPQHESGHRGTQSLYLVQRADQDAPGPEETARIWELRNPVVESPAMGETLYWCRVFRIPTITRKHHLIRYEPVQGINGANGLQHVVLYECQDNPVVERLADTPGRQCYEPHAQPLSCNTVVASWAKGSEGFSFPPEAGYPLDSQYSRFYLMETHYTSPMDGSMGSLDGSGLRLYYTPDLRRHDAGVISMGMDPNWRHIIPPGQQSVVSSGHCVADCTRQAFPHSGINMFAVVMKTHKIGKKVALRHIRSGVEQPPIASDDNIDSDYQEYRKLGVPVRILPGDHLITQCTYNSSGRTAITLGGLNSREETCLVMGLYYPRQKALAACHSLPSLPTVLHSLGIQELSPGSNPVKIAAPPELAGMTLESRLVSYDWDNQFHSFQEATMKGSFKPLCWTAQSTLLPNTDKDSHYPNISRPYIKSVIDQCNYRRYSTEGWPGGTPILELDGNHIEGAARSKVSRSSSPAAEESLGLSRFNTSGGLHVNGAITALSVFLVWFHR